MKLGMRLRPLIRLQLRCPICSESITKHSDCCPLGQLEFFYQNLLNIDCPVCNKHNCIQLNQHDYYECEKCNVQFSSSPVVFDEDTEKLNRICLVDWKANHPIPVLVLKENGKGIFPIRRTIEQTSKRLEKM